MATKRKLTIIRPDGTCETKTIGTAVLKELQALVGGYIESVPHFTKYDGKRCQAWCNENGRNEQLAINPKATELWKQAMRWTPEKQAAGEFWYEPEVFGTLVIDQKHTD